MSVAPVSAPHPLVPEVDVVVVGGGVVGSCLAGFLAEEGRGVAIVDDGRIGGSNANAGSLHVQMQSRFMRLYPQNVPAMERQLPLYPKAVAFWRELQETIGADFDLKMTGGLMVAESEAQLAFLAAKAERERALGLNVEILGRAELDRIAPYLGPAIVGAEFCGNEGKLNPLRCNAAIRRWVAAKGVALVDDETISGIRRTGRHFELISGRGLIRAGEVALAAASGTKALAAELGCHIPAEPEPLHMNITEAAPPLVSHLVQHADRMITLKQLGTGQIVIGGGWPARVAERHRGPAVQLPSLIANVTLAQHIVPRIAPLRIVRTWGGINTAVDGKGVLGPIASQPGLFIAIPGDAGYTLGPLSARLVADSMLGREPAHDIGDFSPDRFAAA